MPAHGATEQPAASLECCALANPVLGWLLPNLGPGTQRGDGFQADKMYTEGMGEVARLQGEQTP